MKPASDNRERASSQFIEQLNQADAKVMEVTKPSNPKDILGSNRAPLSLTLTAGEVEEALAMAEGMLKYGKNNFRIIGVRASVYIDALLRHVRRYLEGEDRDTKTLTHHLGYVRACAGILLDAIANNKLTDDRPPSSPESIALLDGAEARMKKLRETFKDYDPKHYTIWDTPIEVPPSGALPDDNQLKPSDRYWVGRETLRCPFVAGNVQCILHKGHEGLHAR